MRGTLLTIALSAAALGGCYTTGEVGYRAAYAGPSADVYVSTPDLVTVSPGVQVVADYDEPVFYTDGFYWRFYNGGWYRSNNYATGWFFVDRPPVAVLRIDRPYAYAHYRPNGYVVRNRARYRPPENIVVRDQRRVYRPEPVIRGRPEVRTAPVVRERTDVRSAPVVRERTDVRDAPRREAPPARKAPAKDD
ncbi:MAG TPA: hypothetical protein VGD80_41605, partial [Kofleriaceae bacterium]